MMFRVDLLHLRGKSSKRSFTVSWSRKSAEGFFCTKKLHTRECVLNVNHLLKISRPRNRRFVRQKNCKKASSVVSRCLEDSRISFRLMEASMSGSPATPYSDIARSKTT